MRMLVHNFTVERIRPTTMGDLQHFCLRWNNYQNSITTAFENLRDDEDFIDVTLACDGKTLKAHRVVLSACSPYFRELLKSTPCKHPVIVLQDVVFDDLHALVEFIYHGEVNVHQRNLTSFLKTAEVLKVSGLTQQNPAAPSTPASSASPSSDHYNDNMCTRFATRSPSTPPDKANPFQQPLHSSPHQTNNSNEGISSPRTLQQQIRHRRHIRSPTPIRASYTRDDFPISSKRAKSADNASPILNCSANASPTTVIGDETISAIRTRKNSCDGSSSSRRNSPSSINNNNNYDENHNDEDPAAAVDREHDDEPPVDFSTNNTKKYVQESGQYVSSKGTSPKNLSMKSEPMDLVSNHNNNNNNENDNDNQFNDEDSNQWEDRLSDQSPPPVNPYPQAMFDHEDAFPGHRSFLESKIFNAGASFSFNMAAAALAADSLAGFNHHQSHTNMSTTALIDGLSGPSPGLLLPPPPMTGNINEPQDCPHCHRTFSCYYSLKRHFQDKHEHRNTLYVCEFCHRRYRTKNSLTTHKSLQHRGSAGMLKRLIRSTSSHFSQPFSPRFQSTSLLFESIMYNNNNV